jgi:hypothetical protein
VFKRAEEKGIKIEVTDKFKDRLVDEGFNPTYGARPLRRAIMRLIEDCLAERILTGDIKVGEGGRWWWAGTMEQWTQDETAHYLMFSCIARVVPTLLGSMPHGCMCRLLRHVTCTLS